MKETEMETSADINPIVVKEPIKIHGQKLTIERKNKMFSCSKEPYPYKNGEEVIMLRLEGKNKDGSCQITKIK